MRLFQVSFKYLLRSRNRVFLTIGAIAVAMMLFINLMGLKDGYTRSILKSVNQLGAQLLAIPKGCPYEATALILYGGILPSNLPESMLQDFAAMDNVDRYYGLLMGMLPSPGMDKKSDILYGVTNDIFFMKPDWNINQPLFGVEDGVVLGFHKAKARELNEGDYVPVGSKGNHYKVLRILPELGTEDDNVIYMPLHRAQEELGVGKILTGVAVTLKDVRLISESTALIEKLPDVQVITMTQVIDSVMRFLTMIQAFLMGILAITLFASALQLLNTLYMSVLEQIKELGIMKAIGASNGQLALLVVFQSLSMALVGNVLAIALSYLLKPWVQKLMVSFIPTAPSGSLLYFSTQTLALSFIFVLGLGFIAALYPILRIAKLSPLAVMSMEERS
jgi:putative ABC transport system permease protein